MYFLGGSPRTGPRKVLGKATGTDILTVLCIAWNLSGNGSQACSRDNSWNVFIFGTGSSNCAVSSINERRHRRLQQQKNVNIILIFLRVPVNEVKRDNINKMPRKEYFPMKNIGPSQRLILRLGNKAGRMAQWGPCWRWVWSWSKHPHPTTTLTTDRTTATPTTTTATTTATTAWTGDAATASVSFSPHQQQHQKEMAGGGGTISGEGSRGGHHRLNYRHRRSGDMKPRRDCGRGRR